MQVSLDQATEILKNEGVVGMPTETVYGLAGSIQSEKALKLIFSTKARPFFDPLIVHVSSFEMLKPLVKEWTTLHQSFAEFFWPGPLTLVLPKSERISDLITSGLPDVGIRWPQHPVAQSLISASGPLAAPSANKFGKTSPTEIKHVEDEFEGQVAVLDGGSCQVGIESTVLAFKTLSPGEVLIEIYRPGQLGEKEFREWAEKRGVNLAVKYLSSQASPGHTPEHYQPRVPLFIVEQGQQPETELILKYLSDFESGPVREMPLVAHRMVLNSDNLLAARELYAQMRRASIGANYILCEVPAEYDSTDWIAVRDRLTRASRKDIRRSKMQS